VARSEASGGTSRQNVTASEQSIDLRIADLLDESARLNTAILSARRDEFFSFWYSSPGTDEIRRRAIHAARDYLDATAHLVSAIPHTDTIVDKISFVAQLLASGTRQTDFAPS
jgi:hypothetical protein